jgi:TetR/AcrR family transcriptional repressor of nem operon
VRYKADQKEESRARLLAAAGRAFRRRGFDGIGVDGLVREAGVTSGAFYGHFKSKEEAFAAVAIAGLEALRATILEMRAAHPGDWLAQFVETYLGERLTCDLGESCGLQSLTSDVMRADPGVRAGYEAAYGRVAEALADGLEEIEVPQREEIASAILALLSGGVTLARSLASDAARSKIAQGLKRQVLRLATPPPAP